jgi:hypothetical protein
LNIVTLKAKKEIREDYEMDIRDTDYEMNIRDTDYEMDIRDTNHEMDIRDTDCNTVYRSEVIKGLKYMEF